MPDLKTGQIEKAAQGLAQLRQRADATDEWRLLIDKLQTIVAGSRDEALADDMALDYSDAAEILLLERLVGV
ncbi:MAG: hypothetical protein AAF639_29065 [Chloroflexota bacterium]